MLDDVEPKRLARDLGIRGSTAHRDVNQALTVVAQRAPSLHGTLIAARAAGHTLPRKRVVPPVNLDGTLMRTDRVSLPGPTTKKTTKNSGPKRKKVDLFWSGKHHCHGGSIQFLTAPDGWPLWVCQVRPGREHDLTAARADPHLPATLSRLVR